MKKTIFLIASLFIATLSYSQFIKERPKSIIGAEVLMPVGELSKNYDVGFCTSIQVGFKETESYYLYMSSGYNYIFGKGKVVSLIQFPANVGGYYNLSEMVSIGSSAGVIYTREAYNGFNFNFSNSLRVTYDVFNFELKYSSVVKKGSKNDLNGISIKFSYIL